VGHQGGPPAQWALAMRQEPRGQAGVVEEVLYGLDFFNSFYLFYLFCLLIRFFYYYPKFFLFIN
jgi:hypothetical protein